MSLEDWGWDDDWQSALESSEVEGAEPARVTRQERTIWTLETRGGPREARCPKRVDRPVVGDWVVATSGIDEHEPWSIRRVLRRRTRFSRRAAGSRAEEQVLAANIDRVWIAHGLDVELNGRRLERYLAVAWESGASPEIVLTKADIAVDLEGASEEAKHVAFGLPVWVVSTVQSEGCDQIAASLVPGQTVALLGPSGVGKSSLINRLAGADLLEVGDVRQGDRKGRHTTTRRELVLLEGGGLLLDTPGLRELQVWDLDEGLTAVFPEIDALAGECRFRDCQHQTEPGCAVLEAVGSGQLPMERLASYRKLEAEAEYQRRKADPHAMAKTLAEWKSAMKSMRYHPKYRRDRG